MNRSCDCRHSLRSPDNDEMSWIIAMIAGYFCCSNGCSWFFRVLSATSGRLDNLTIIFGVFRTIHWPLQRVVRLSFVSHSTVEKECEKKNHQWNTQLINKVHIQVTNVFRQIPRRRINRWNAKNAYKVQRVCVNVHAFPDVRLFFLNLIKSTCIVRSVIVFKSTVNKSKRNNVDSFVFRLIAIAINDGC